MKKIISVICLLAANLATADEGMWQPHQLPELETLLKQRGLQLDAASLADLTKFPMNAVISLGGCTASFVSPQGLALTNHHCAYSSIQYNSKADNNLLQKGYLAKTFAEELPAAPGAKIYVTEQVQNVTQAILQELEPQLQGRDRFDAIDLLRKDLVAQCEVDPGYRCEVYSFHGGLEYYLIKQLEIRDVRLVYAPAMGIGKFGGDVDNWMWPRHTGDYSFYRAYVNKDGKPADFSADNVPYTPPSFLKVSAKGVADGDFVMVLGYPGRTNRHMTANEVRHQFSEVLPQSKAYREQLMALINQHTAPGSDERIRYEAILASLANYAKNFDGMLRTYQQGDTQARKDQFDKAFLSWLNKESARKIRYLPAVNALDQLIEQQAATSQRDLILQYFDYAQAFGTARKLYRYALEQHKDDAVREAGYQQRDVPRLKAGLNRMSRSYVPAVDLEIALHFIKLYVALPAEQRLPAFDKFFHLEQGFDEVAVRAQLSGMYEKTSLSDEAQRLAWLEKPIDEMTASTDPMLQFAVAMSQTDLQLEEQQKERLGKLSSVRPKVMAAVIAFHKSQQQPVYADANGTLRVTYGNVRGYAPVDGLFKGPFTTLQGIAKKHTGQEPFAAPTAQLAAISKGDWAGYQLLDQAMVPVNFLSTVDTTGGNSGSPTLNGKAELVGLLFDGVIEGIIGNYSYDAALNRSIHVDSRYLLWQMEKVDDASNLLQEMSIVRD